ncbi:MAG: hypothetical protein K0Q71_5286 [Thermomicrobiales bacterium]|nr:hypothetical protein [Thermomicrobiales bacterium]
MTRQRLVGLVLLLGALLLSAVPIRGAAQTNAEFFEQVVTGELSAPLLAGPYDFLLEQTPGTLSAFKAGVDVRNFVAHAAFTNPEVDEGAAWDYGFQFRTTGNNEDLRIFLVSDGTWNLSIGTDFPEQSVVAPNFDATPGAVNTLDIIVEEFQAIVGINGEFAGVVALLATWSYLAASSSCGTSPSTMSRAKRRRRKRPRSSGPSCRPAP